MKVRPLKSVIEHMDDDWTIGKLLRRADIAPNTARRYWYGTRDGRPDGEAMVTIDLMTLRKVADTVGLDWQDLIDDTDDTQGDEG